MIRALLFLLLLAGTAFGQTRVQPVPLANAKWTTGFWAERYENCRTAMIPAMGKIMVGTERSQFLHNFRIAAGLVEGAHKGPSWNDGDLYKWIEAAAATLAVSPDAKLEQQLDDAIAIIAKAQRSDGYLHTPVLVKNQHGDSAKPFEDRLNFEMYNFGHLFTAACVHHQATGKRSLLNVAIKAANFLEEAFQHPTPELAHNSICPSHYMGIIDLYRVTHDPKYLALAKKFVELRDLMANGTDDNQDRVPFRQQTEAVGHAVRANYLYAGIADIYAETGDKTLLPPLEKIWTNMTSQKMYVTGACGALYDGASPDGSKEQKQISRTHQAYGRNYQLPNSTAYNETCANIGNVLWNSRMLAITGDAKYAELMELALINAVLPGVSLDGKQFFYTNTLRQLDTMPTELRWSRTRESWISCYCCPPNVARTIAQASQLAYGRANDAVWFHLYGSSSLDTELPNGGRVQLTQETLYPWDGRIKVTVKECPDRGVALTFRIPSWADGATITVNGEKRKTTPAGTYVSVRRTWKAGDIVELNLPMRVRLLQSHPLVEETRNHVAVQRGPVVYCSESSDLDKSTRLQNVRVSESVQLKPRHDAKLLGGVTLLEGDATAVTETDWKHELYREVRPAASRSLHIQLVPYFTWGNRGPSEMTVWLPLNHQRPASRAP